MLFQVQLLLQTQLLLSTQKAKVFLVLLCAFICPVVAAGNLTELDSIVVTGTRSEKLMSDTPVKTELVTRQEIEEQHARNAKEALEVVPGLLIKPIHGKSGYEVWMQGLDSDRVKVLIDGEPVATSSGSSVDVSQIDALNIERIEVVKGATSALYGSSAMGGVINIITRNTLKGYKWELKSEAGSFDKDNFSENRSEAVHYLGAIKGSYRDNIHFISIGASTKQSDGFDATPGDWPSQGPKGLRNNVDIKLGWTPTATTRISLFGNTYHEDLSTRTQSNAGGKLIQQLKDEDTDRRRIGSKIYFESEYSTYSWRMLKERYENSTYQDVLATADKENYRNAKHNNFNTAFDYSWSKYDAHLISAGIEWKEQALEQSKDGIYEVLPGTKSQSLEFYLQDDIFLSDHWELVPGIRVQNDNDFGFHSAPKINVRYDFLSRNSWESFVRGGVGHGYRVPNLKERHYIFDHSHLGYMVVGNNDLAPEKSTSYQLGLGFLSKTSRATQSTIDINLFYNDVANLIETAFDETLSSQRSDNVSIFSYVNIKSAKTYGTELLYAQEFNGPLSLSLGYTHTVTEDNGTGKHLPNRPQHQTKASLRYKSSDGRLVGILNHSYLSKEFIDIENQRVSPSSNLFDIRVNYTLSKSLKLYSGVDNLTNVQRNFQDPNDQRPVTGRFFYLGLTLTN